MGGGGDGGGGLPREERWMMVCGYKKLFFPRENHVLCLALSRLFLFLVSEDLICSVLQKRKLPLRLHVALT